MIPDMLNTLWRARRKGLGGVCATACDLAPAGALEEKHYWAGHPTNNASTPNVILFIPRLDFGTLLAASHRAPS